MINYYELDEHELRMRLMEAHAALEGITLLALGRASMGTLEDCRRTLEAIALVAGRAVSEDV